MIYLKTKKGEYNINNLPFLYRQELREVLKIIKSQEKTILNDYPNIDIVINTKKQKRALGRFYIHRRRKGIEYNFLGDKNNPCIVLFWSHILEYYGNRCILGLLKVLYHEYGHYKQWLLDGKVGHNKKIKANSTNTGLTAELKTAREYLRIEGGTS